jgi:Asp-tRNA(Asn)/Glu-tRNA(Gln) amidotransferase A subunit family amidase
MRLAELTTGIRRGQFSSEELVSRSLERIERLNQGLNAVVSLRADQALAEAREIDRSVGCGEHPLPLAGIPALVKDMEDVTGMRTTFGSLVFADAPPASGDGLIPRRLRKAGAVILGKTNLSELAWAGEYTTNRVFGATRNPWGVDWSPGGSSGGSASALAAGLAPIATASDGGGSTRVPAALCGLVGLKPTHGLIGREPIPDWIDLSETAPLTTTLDDLRLLLEVQSGPVAGDPTALPSQLDLRNEMPTRIIAAERFTDEGPLPAAIRGQFASTLHSIEADLGLPVEELRSTDVFRAGPLADDWYTICGVEQLHNRGQGWVEEHWDQFDASFQRGMEAALQVSLEQYLRARRRRFDYVRELDLLLGTDAVLVTPTLGWQGWTQEGIVPETGELPDNRAYNTFAPNMCGHPALSVPAGTSPNGIPFGVTFTGPRFRDDMLLTLGEAWLRLRPWRAVAPGYEAFPE